jgi:glucose/arabinose dehydrogenase
MVARARLSVDAARLEEVKVLLDAEGIGGRLIQSGDGTLLITSSIPAGVGINSEDWPQPQLDSLMGKILRIKSDGSVPADNPFVGRSDARPEIFALGIRDDQGVAFHPHTGHYFWTPDIGPAGISFYTGRLFPEWRSSLFVAALAGKHLARLVLDGERVIAEERLLTELDARIRDVHEGPDGALYVMTDREGGKIVRLVSPNKRTSASK